MRIEQLSVVLDNRRILEDISFEIPPGSRAALMGRNGSGKSVLLLAIAGLVPFRARRVAVGEPIGFVFQDPEAGWTAPSVEEEILFALACRGVGRREAARRCEEILADFGFRSLRGRSPDTLSGGEQQRLQVAAVAATRPRTLLLDEPTEHLDPLAGRNLEAYLTAGAPAPEIVLRATHDLEIALGCDRLLVLSEGRLVAAGPPAEIARRSEWADWIGSLPPAAAAARLVGDPRALMPPLPVTWGELESRCS